MKPMDEKAEVLLCIQDNTPVREDGPGCLHPSSYCAFRESCQILERQRRNRREAGQADEQ
jgi:hypothetical protein